MALAIFDLDNTLINGDSDHAWGNFLIDENMVDAKEYEIANHQFYLDYKNGVLDINEYLNFCLKPLAVYSNEVLEKLHNKFMQTVITPMMLDKAKVLLKKHRDQGDYLLIITATNEFVTGPIAKELKVDDLIASQCEQVDGKYTGKPSGTPSFQEGKITRLNEWLKNNPMDLEGSYFYSDSHNDLPLLKMVTHPIAVDADETLTDYAKEHNWKIMSLR
ncbi:MAG: HAD family hydrolase [Saccharospirillaceae bacterium]|nr:HAD-IB family hydrolase [Pseudomonadales bacterium]NRB79257.1 HAD family hydrolase [Saccharospirillaceae bacterium]